jgi:hypothetical protein
MFEELGHVPQSYLAMEVPQWQHDLSHINYGQMNGRWGWISSIVGEIKESFADMDEIQMLKGDFINEQ